MFYVVSVGCNSGLGAKTLNFAERDAEEIGKVYTSALAPPATHLTQLTGAQATTAGLRQALADAEGHRPDYFLLFVSSHGSRDGVLLRDGVFAYEELVRWMQMVDAPFSTIILDVCYAASYLDFLKEAHRNQLDGQLELSWMDALANATPGSRLMFSTGRDRLSCEGGRVRNGHFTYGIVSALTKARGDLASGGSTLISDQRAFSFAKSVMRQHLGTTQQPVERGITGDFPLALSQADAPVGEAEFLELAGRRIGVGMDVRFKVDGRNRLATRVSVRVRNVIGTDVLTRRDIVVPTGNDVFEGTVSFAVSDLLKDPVCQLQWSAKRSVPTDWIISLEDQQGRTLDEKVVPVRYVPLK